MQRVIVGVIFGGILLTVAGILVRVGRAPEPLQPEKDPGGTERAQRLADLQPRLDKPVDLLGMIDPGKDAVAGAWRSENGVLVCSRSRDYPRLQVPCVPPEEYDLQVTVERGGTPEALVLGLATPGRQFIIHLDGKLFAPNGELIAPVCSTLRKVDGQNSGASMYSGTALKDGAPSTIVCSVRRSGVEVRVDDQPILSFKGDLRRLSLPPSWKVPSDQALFLGAYDCEYRFSKIVLKPLN
jgi:hypothetical protein